MCGQKRPWNDLDMNTSKLLHSEGLDLNATASEAEVAQGGCNAGVRQALDNPAGVHDTSRYSSRLFDRSRLVNLHSCFGLKVSCSLHRGTPDFIVMTSGLSC